MTYRDDRHALETRAAALESELTRMQSQAAELRPLAARIQDLEVELAGVRRRLQTEPTTRRLPLLDDVQIASPCNADWNKMQGDERARFCGECQKHVYNLSAMSRVEAEAFLSEQVGSVCVRLYRRTDGTVLTQDCPVGLRWKRRRRAALVAVGVGVTAAGAALMASLALMGTAPRHSQGAVGGPSGYATQGELPSPPVAVPEQGGVSPAPVEATMGQGVVAIPRPLRQVAPHTPRDARGQHNTHATPRSRAQ